MATLAAVHGWRDEVYGQSRGCVPLRVFLPAGDGPVAGLLCAAQHGEEPETLLLARRLLERVPGDESRWAVVPCLNPDGVLSGVRQNAAGVDLNRNFPSSTWRPDPSFTYPPGCLDRRPPNRTNRSSPGEQPASEPETRAVIALIERLAPPLIIDLHSPLEVILRTPDAPDDVTRALAQAASLPVRDELDGPAPGSLDDWCTDRGLAALVYEVEHAALPALCRRHLPGLEAVLR